MAPVAARRAAAVAVRHLASAPPRDAAVAVRHLASAPPRAAAIHRAAPRAATHPSAVAANASSFASGSAATHPCAVTAHASSSVTATRSSTGIAPSAGRLATSGSAATHPCAVTAHASSSVTATRSSTGIAPSAGRLVTRFGLPSGRLTKSTAPTGLRLVHQLVARPLINPHVQIELSRLEARDFCRYKEIAEAIQQSGLKLKEEEVATLQYLTEHIIHVGTVSWRVCTTVLTVAVGAGFGVLQLAKSGWEREFHESACSLITSRLAETKLELEDDMVKGITHRRNVAVANAFLDNEKTKEKALELAEREAALLAREEALVAREAALVAK